MSVLIKHFAMPKGCIYANDKDETEYCPMLNHDDVPFCQYIENEPEAAIGIDERPVYCPLEEYSEPCEDAVSRQAIFDTAAEYEKQLCEILGDENELVEVVEILKHRLIALPSARPEKRTEKRTEERTETHACDLIDRQAAIDALEKVAELFPWRVPGNCDTYDRYNEAWNDAIGRAEIEIEELSSAQPEIIRCKDCKKNPHWEWVGCPMTGKDTRKPDDFCSYAERRTDGSD